MPQSATAALVVCLALTLSGCVMATIVRLSVPTVDERAGVQLREGVLELPDVKLAVRPRNTVVPVTFLGVLVPVIPVPSGLEPESLRALPFRVHVQLEASSDVFRIDLQRVILELDGARHAPTGASVPRRMSDMTGGPDATQPGFTWHCADREPDARPVAVGGGPVAVPPGRACFVVEYAMWKPAPDRTFAVSVEGLERSGTPVPVPAIRFAPGSSSTFGLARFRKERP